MEWYGRKKKLHGGNHWCDITNIEEDALIIRLYFKGHGQLWRHFFPVEISGNLVSCICQVRYPICFGIRTLPWYVSYLDCSC